MNGFFGLTEEMCKKAFELTQPAIGIAMKRKVVNRSQGFLAVLDPRIVMAIKPEVGWDHRNEKLSLSRFRSRYVLFSHVFGLKNEWEHPFEEVALAKAWASWATGLPSHRLQTEAPYLYTRGMPKYGGSAVDASGHLIIAFSGVEEWFDQMFSEMMLAAIKGVCLHEMHGLDGVMANADLMFVGTK